MRRHLFRLTILCCLAMSTGCLARQFKRDGASSQEAVSEIYTEQAMNNLIRARCNLPFVQLKYDSIAITDGDEISATAGLTQVIDSAVALIVGGGIRTVTDTANVSGTAARRRSMSFNADPITDENDIYTSYIEFARDPNLFCVSDHAPPCPVHLHRKSGKKHFWIPLDAGPAFFDLVMQTSIMRGPDTMPPGAYEAVIVRVSEYNKTAKGAMGALVHFDKKTIPNGDAVMVFNMKESGRTVRVPLTKIDNEDNDKKKPPVQAGILVDMLKIQWTFEKYGFAQEDLPGLKVRIFSAEYPPGLSRPDPLAKRISSNVNRLTNRASIGR